MAFVALAAIVACFILAAVLLFWDDVSRIANRLKPRRSPPHAAGASLVCGKCRGVGWLWASTFWEYCSCVPVQRTPRKSPTTSDAITRDMRTRSIVQTFQGLDAKDAEVALLGAALVDLVEALPRCGWPVERGICGLHATTWCEGSGTWYCDAHAPDGYDDATHAEPLRVALAMIGRVED